MADYSKKLQKDINKIELSGRIIKGELKYSTNGFAIMNCVLANNNDYQKNNGEIIKRCNYIDLCIFGEKAVEFNSQIGIKKDIVNIEGNLEQQSWEDKQTGQKRSKFVVNVWKFSKKDYKNNSQSYNYEDIQSSDDCPF